MKFMSFATAAAVAALSITATANAVVTGYVANPTTNSVDWTNAVITGGGTVVTNIDFDGPNVGASYTATTGQTAVQFGNGPAQGNTFSAPLSPGEGLHAASNYLFVNTPNLGPIDVVVNFSSLVGAAGFFTIDHFNPSGNGFINVLNLSAYTGANGTGTWLGTVTSAQFNFQNNNLYFMRVVSTSNDIGSIVFNRSSDNTGDTIGIDDIVSGSFGTTVPEPASWALMIAGFGMVGAAQRSVLRRRKAVLAA